MAEENPNPNPMNLDLNLGLLDSSSDIGDFGSVSNPDTAINLTDWLEAHRVRQVVRNRNRNRTRRPSSWSRQLHLPSEAGPRGEVSYECRTEETTKTCQNNPKSCTEDNADREKDKLTKKSTQENGFFDCNICFDLAKDPVVTCCGHLFCWPCLYRWLHHHSAARECPVCKGEVNLKNVVPIYGRGDSARGSANMDSILPVPGRPQAQRVESWRQSVVRNASVVPLEELITRPATTIDLQRGLAQREQNQNSDSVRGPMDEFNSVLHNGILTSGRMHGDSPTPGWNSDDVDFLRDVELVLANESLLEQDMRRVSVEFSPPFDDRDSLSSIAAMIQSESQTVDNNVIEIDSTVAPSTSSRRRNDASRISEADSGDSQVLRRRRRL